MVMGDAAVGFIFVSPLLMILRTFPTCFHLTAALAHAETAAATAKTEYDIVLSEMRDPAFIEEYGAERLTLAKEQAKDMLTTANRYDVVLLCISLTGVRSLGDARICCCC